MSWNWDWAQWVCRADPCRPETGRDSPASHQILIFAEANMGRDPCCYFRQCLETDVAMNPENFSVASIEIRAISTILVDRFIF